jgi:Tol biopolymer transport system component
MEQRLNSHRYLARGCASGCAVVLAVAVVAFATPAQAAADDTTLVSRGTGAAGAAASGDSNNTSVSADGRYVAFTSSADNLSTEDNDAYVNVYVRDRQAGTTTLVSRAGGTAGTGANGDSFEPEISDNGTHVVFRTVAANLSTQDLDTCPDWWWGDVGPCSDIFVRDLLTGTTTYVSRAPGLDGAAATGGSYNPSISADGRQVSFSSIAEKLSDADTHECYTSEGSPYPCANFFVRDLQTGVVKYLAMASGGPGVSLPCKTSISADGRFVAYDTDEDQLVGNNSAPDVYVADVQTGTLTYVSRADGPNGADAGWGGSACPSISADGRYIAFASAADNLSDADGNRTDIFVRDVQDGRTILVSRATGVSGVGGNSYSTGPSISPDGRYVGFQSDADNLSGSDVDTVNGVLISDVFMRDLQENVTHYLSRSSGATGAAGADHSDQAAVSTGGLAVAFASRADNLSTQDNDAYRNVFVREPGAPGVPPANCTSATLAANADSWVRQSTSSTNYGKNATLRVDSKSYANSRSLVRFTLPAIPTGCTVTGAELQLYATSYKSGRTVTARPIAASWNETTVTWTNKPAVTGTTATAAARLGWVKWTVTGQVQAMYAGSNHGFMIRDATESAYYTASQVFNSRDSGTTTPPKLIVTFGPN